MSGGLGPHGHLPTDAAFAQPQVNRPVQTLSAFRLPQGFRGRSAMWVQLWWLTQATAFRWSPQVMYGWRRWLLRCFGARIGTGVIVRPTAAITYPWKVTIGDYSWIGDNVTLYSLGDISIGSNTVISQRSYLCAGTHDYRTVSFDILGIPISIEDEAWIGTDVFIAPGTKVGRGCVVGARSSVFKDLPAMSVCIGSPAKPVRHRVTSSSD